MGKTNHIGFSGSRLGMSLQQKSNVFSLLHQFYVDCRAKGHREVWFHHGDAIGADTEATEIAKNLGFKIHRHPPLNPKSQSFTEYDVTDKCWSYHGRNQRIVHAVCQLIATPYHSNENTGGTWYTTGFCQTVGVPCNILYRDGKVERRPKDAPAN